MSDQYSTPLRDSTSIAELAKFTRNDDLLRFFLKDDDANPPIRFRKFIERNNIAKQQCHAVIGKPILKDSGIPGTYNFEPSNSHCWLCGFPLYSDDPVHCEHVLPIMRAMLMLGVYHPQTVTEQNRKIIKLNYLYAHGSCNMAKSNLLLIKWDPMTNKMVEDEYGTEYLALIIMQNLSQIHRESTFGQKHRAEYNFLLRQTRKLGEGNKRYYDMSVYYNALRNHYSVVLKPILSEINRQIGAQTFSRDYFFRRFTDILSEMQTIAQIYHKNNPDKPRIQLIRTQNELLLRQRIDKFLFYDSAPWAPQRPKRNVTEFTETGVFLVIDDDIHEMPPVEEMPPIPIQQMPPIQQMTPRRMTPGPRITRSRSKAKKPSSKWQRSFHRSSNSQNKITRKRMPPLIEEFE
jgi:hypothetical protein